MTRLPSYLEYSLILLALVTSVTDIRTRRIPNWIVVAGFAAGISGNVYAFGWLGLRGALLGFLCGFALYLPLYLLQGRGGGDLKLMAAMGTITGYPNFLFLFLLTSIFGGIFAVGYLLIRGGLIRALSNVVYIVKELLLFRPPSLGRPELSIENAKALTMPHAVVVAIAVLVFLTLTRLATGG